MKSFEIAKEIKRQIDLLGVCVATVGRAAPYQPEELPALDVLVVSELVRQAFSGGDAIIFAANISIKVIPDTGSGDLDKQEKFYLLLGKVIKCVSQFSLADRLDFVKSATFQGYDIETSEEGVIIAAASLNLEVVYLQKITDLP